MNDFLVVLNAGSSSLKFCVYGTGAEVWQLEARGQVEGIGTAPRFSVKDGGSRRSASFPWTGRCATPTALGSSRPGSARGFRKQT